MREARGVGRAREIGIKVTVGTIGIAMIESEVESEVIDTIPAANGTIIHETIDGVGTIATDTTDTTVRVKGAGMGIVVGLQ